MTAVLIYSSGPRSDCEEWKARFDRYTTASSDPSRSPTVFMSSQAEECLQWFLERNDCQALVLWDASGRVPPKEIEMLLTRLERNALVVTTRFGADSIGRGITVLQFIGGRLLSRIRRAGGFASDVQPACLGIRRDTFSIQFFKDLKPPVAGWTMAIFREARYRRIPILETSVMWAPVADPKSGALNPR